MKRNKNQAAARKNLAALIWGFSCVFIPIIISFFVFPALMQEETADQKSDSRIIIPPAYDFDPKGETELLRYITYTYDSPNRILEKITYDAQGSREQVETLVYDKQGILVYRQMENGAGDLQMQEYCINEYDEEKRLLTQTVYEGDVLARRYDYEYRDDDTACILRLYDEEEKAGESYGYLWNKERDILLMIPYDGAGNKLTEGECHTVSLGEYDFFIMSSEESWENSVFRGYWHKNEEGRLIHEIYTSGSELEDFLWYDYYKDGRKKQKIEVIQDKEDSTGFLSSISHYKYNKNGELTAEYIYRIKGDYHVRGNTDDATLSLNYDKAGKLAGLNSSKYEIHDKADRISLIEIWFRNEDGSILKAKLRTDHGKYDWN